jgi:hypothetical protein
MSATERRSLWWRRASVATAVITAFLCLGLLATHPVAPSLPPDVPGIQAAYDAEKASGSRLHADDLLIQNSDCTPAADHGYDCQVSYVRKASLNGRLYFDVVALEPRTKGWKLISGLCRGKAVETPL